MSAPQRREDAAPTKTRPLRVVADDERTDPPRPAAPPPPERTPVAELLREYPDLMWLGLWGPPVVAALMLGIGQLLIALVGLVATLALGGALIVVCIAVFIATTRERGGR